MSRGRILVVDDNEEFLEEITDTLNCSGFEVSTVSNGEAALRFVQKVSPELILLDIKMRGLSGFQVADRLSKNPVTSEIPIIAITGVFTREGDDKLMKICSIKKCLNKPFAIHELMNVIEEVTG